MRVTWTIRAVQNLTAYPVSTTVYPPNLNSSLSGDDLSQFSSALQSSLQLKNNGITVSDVSLHLSSNYINTTCAPCLQWLNASTTFEVHEPAQTRFGVAQYDMSWMALRLNQDLTVGTVGYNRLGEDYLLAAVAPVAAFTSSSEQSQLMTVNGDVVSRIGYQPFVAAIVLFDMSALKPSVEDWSHNLNLGSQSQTWTSPQTGGFNFTATQHFLSENTEIAYVVGTSVSAELSAPLNAVAKGNILFVDYTGGLWDQLSLVTILTSLGVLVTAVVADSRLTRGFGQKRRRGRG